MVFIKLSSATTSTRWRSNCTVPVVYRGIVISWGTLREPPPRSAVQLICLRPSGLTGTQHCLGNACQALPNGTWYIYNNYN